MIITLIFCMFATGLCCYTVHMLLQERAKTESEIFKAMSEIDQIALRGPMRVSKEDLDKAYNYPEIEVINESSFSNRSFKNINDTIISDADIDMVYTKSSQKVSNHYPIKPTLESATAHRFDARF